MHYKARITQSNWHVDGRRMRFLPVVFGFNVDAKGIGKGGFVPGGNGLLTVERGPVST